jgi:hypothetical protein
VSRLDRACYLLAALLFVSGLVHVVILLVTGASWSGPLSFRKPATFGLSFGLTLATVTWVSAFLPASRRVRARLLGAFAPACLVEVVVITVQAWRGRPSHFGLSGTEGALAGAGAAAGAAVIVVTTVVATVIAFRPAPGTAPSMRLALRAGFGSLLVTLLLGVYMLARGMVIARAGAGVPAAFAFTGGLKPGHAVAMHGVLVLPALAWLLSFADRPERVRLGVVRLASAGYALLVAVVLAEVLAGVDPVDLGTAPVVATALAAVGAAAIAAAGVVALAAVARSARPSRRPARRGAA